jgi:quercetin dioxygenase-like cupin family protein
MADPPTTTAGTHNQPGDGTWSTPAPRLLCDARALTVLAAAPAGELWRLSVPGSELAAGISHLLPGQRVNTHTEEAPDTLLLILAGDATVATRHGPQHLTEGTLLWLPRGSTAGLTAGENGLWCLTVHRRRPLGTPTHRTQQSTPRQPPDASPAPPGGAQSDWPTWLC